MPNTTPLARAAVNPVVEPNTRKASLMGWLLGDVERHDRLIREIANGAHAAVVFVNYSRLPEARFPVAIEEAAGALTGNEKLRLIGKTDQAVDKVRKAVNKVSE